MPVQVASFLVPKNYNKWFILEDSYLKGGFRVCIDENDRNSIHSSCLKPGMLVLTANNNIIWVLKSDLTWTKYSGFSNLHTHKQIEPENTWTIVHNKSCLYYTITCFDISGNVIIPNEIRTLDQNNINVEFLIPLTGWCTISFDLFS